MYFHLISQRRAFAIRELVRRAGFGPGKIQRVPRPVLVHPNTN